MPCDGHVPHDLNRLILFNKLCWLLWQSQGYLPIKFLPSGRTSCSAVAAVSYDGSSMATASYDDMELETASVLLFHCNTLQPFMRIDTAAVQIAR